MGKHIQNLMRLLLAALFLVVTVVATNVRSRNSKVDETRGNNKRKLTIAYDEVSVFKTKYSYKETSLQEVEFSSSRNAMSLEGQTYSFDKLEELSMFSPGFKIYQNGKELESYENHEGFLFFGKDGDNEIFVSHDVNRRVNMIEIHDGEKVTTLLSDFNLDESDSPYENISNFTLDERSYENTTSDQHFFSDGDKIPLDYSDSKELETATSKTIFSMQSACGYHRVIDVAIAFDTAFCKYAGGFNAAVNKAKSIVAIASNKYGQAGLCLKVRLAAVDGRCENKNDPYKKMRYWISGCTGRDGYIDDFGAYWNTYMKYIPRDAAHLFTARKMDGPVGCSGIGVICKRAYGVNQISFFYDMNLQGNLFAHELGHNCGAIHINGNGYLMNPNVNHAQYGFSVQSVYQMNAYLKSATCLHYG